MRQVEGDLRSTHYSVLLAESIEFLSIKPDGVYVDVTAGLGGHTRAIAERLESGRVIACDRDAESLEMARRNTAPFAARICYCHRRFSQLPQALAEYAGDAADNLKVDGVLADLGVSRYQLTSGERGFSLIEDGPLDMRMNRQDEFTAADYVNDLSEKDLADLIYQYGEERRSRRISRAIVRARPILTTGQLARVVEEAVPRTGRLHPATQTFMALRLKVNREFEELDELLRIVPNFLKPGGRFVVLTFMSTEDRKVKKAFLAEAKAGRGVILTKHVVKPSLQEVSQNAASRSSKLRAFERN